MINDPMRRTLAKRDPYCVHCGDDFDLVIHHRKNRGMGGSKKLDVYENLMRVCQPYNSLMESDSKIAQEAIEFGHKLRSWEDYSSPVYDRFTGSWYLLGVKGDKTPVEPPAFLI